MTGIPLRIAEPTGQHVRSLRRFRYTHEGRCDGPGGYHNATVDLGVIEQEEHAPHGDNWPHGDPRWPATCEGCGYWFTPVDQWQRNEDPIYRLPDGSEFTFRHSFGMCAPPGTMIRARWYDEYTDQPGESWLVALPGGGEWITTQKASGGGYWEITGIPPAITVSPSIWHNQPHGWHGFIRGGILQDA